MTTTTTEKLPATTARAYARQWRIRCRLSRLKREFEDVVRQIDGTEIDVIWVLGNLRPIVHAQHEWQSSPFVSTQREKDSNIKVADHSAKATPCFDSLDVNLKDRPPSCQLMSDPLKKGENPAAHGSTAVTPVVASQKVLCQEKQTYFASFKNVGGNGKTNSSDHHHHRNESDQQISSPTHRHESKPVSSTCSCEETHTSSHIVCVNQPREESHLSNLNYKDSHEINDSTLERATHKENFELDETMHKDDSNRSCLMVGGKNKQEQGGFLDVKNDHSVCEQHIVGQRHSCKQVVSDTVEHLSKTLPQLNLRDNSRTDDITFQEEGILEIQQKDNNDFESIDHNMCQATFEQNPGHRVDQKHCDYLQDTLSDKGVNEENGLDISIMSVSSLTTLSPVSTPQRIMSPCTVSDSILLQPSRSVSQHINIADNTLQKDGSSMSLSLCNGEPSCHDSAYEIMTKQQALNDRVCSTHSCSRMRSQPSCAQFSEELLIGSLDHNNGRSLHRQYDKNPFDDQNCGTGQKISSSKDKSFHSDLYGVASSCGSGFNPNFAGPDQPTTICNSGDPSHPCHRSTFSVSQLLQLRNRIQLELQWTRDALLSRLEMQQRYALLQQTESTSNLLKSHD